MILELLIRLHGWSVLITSKSYFEDPSYQLLLLLSFEMSFGTLLSMVFYSSSSHSDATSSSSSGGSSFFFKIPWFSIQKLDPPIFLSFLTGRVAFATGTSFLLRFKLFSRSPLLGFLDLCLLFNLALLPHWQFFRLFVIEHSENVFPFDFFTLLFRIAVWLEVHVCFPVSDV